MSTLDKVTDVTVKNFTDLPENKDKAFDPATIMLIMDIIAQVIAMWQKCRASKDAAAAMANNPTLLQRLVLKRTVVNTVGRQQFRENGDALLKALHKTGAHLSVADVQDLLENE